MRSFLMLFLVALPIALGVDPGFARAEIIVVDTDPGEVGEQFVTRTFPVPSLLGVPATVVTGPQITDDFTQVDFLFSDDRFVRSFVYPGAAQVLELELIYDRAFPAGATSIGGGSQFGGNGFTLDEFGARIRAASFTSTQLQIDHPILTFSIGPDPDFGAPAGSERTVPYYGAHFQWGFSSVGDDAPLIESATLRFNDTRSASFPTESIPHLVGQDSPVPEPARAMLLAALLVVAAVRGMHRPGAEDPGGYPGSR